MIVEKIGGKIEFRNHNSLITTHDKISKTIYQKRSSRALEFESVQSNKNSCKIEYLTPSFKRRVSSSDVINFEDIIDSKIQTIEDESDGLSVIIQFPVTTHPL